jgi:hypothetical protein
MADKIKLYAFDEKDCGLCGQTVCEDEEGPLLAIDMEKKTIEVVCGECYDSLRRMGLISGDTIDLYKTLRNLLFNAQAKS